MSQSVANTVKRTALIFLSIWYFGNDITLFNVCGELHHECGTDCSIASGGPAAAWHNSHLSRVSIGRSH